MSNSKADKVGRFFFIIDLLFITLIGSAVVVLAKIHCRSGAPAGLPLLTTGVTGTPALSVIIGRSLSTE